MMHLDSVERFCFVLFLCLFFFVLNFANRLKLLFIVVLFFLGIKQNKEENSKNDF